jgi:hypothetical protein
VILPSPVEASKSVLNHLKAAEKAIWKGEYDTVLVSCRKVIEADKSLFEDKVHLEKRLGSESKARIVKDVCKQLKDFLNKGAHIGSTITRRDADFALLLTQNLVAYINRPTPSLPE